MNIQDLLIQATNAVAPLAAQIAGGIAFARGIPAVKERFPWLLSGMMVRVLSALAGVVIAGCSLIGGASVPEPFAVLGIWGVFVYGLYAGLTASGTVDLVRSLLPSTPMPASLKIDDLPDDVSNLRLLSAPGWDTAEMLARGVKSFTGFPADLLFFIVKRVSEVVLEPEMAWSKIGQIVSRVQAGKDVTTACTEVLG